MQTLPQNLVDYGRNGDSMLVHMNPAEVAGLQALAESQGTSLTINPNTGMPEAFNLGDFFLNLLPTIVGAALAPSTFGGSLGLTGAMQTAAPIVGGALTGAALAGAKGEDPLLGGLTGGLGGFGGSNIAGGLAKFGAPAATPKALAPINAVTEMKDAGIIGPGIQLTSGASGYDALNPVVNPLVANAPNFAPVTATTGMSPFSAGVSKAIQNPSAYMESIGGPLGVAKEYGMPLGGAVLAGLEPSDLGYTTLNDTRKDKDKYDPYATLNLSGDTGLRLLAQGGEVEGYAGGGLLPAYYDMGGNFSTYEGPDQASPMPQLSQDGYGLGRLNQLAQQQSATRAASDVFAKGGYLDGAGDGMSDSIPATIGGKQPARLADGEFVVPADVVSHLGNGSSKAGAKRLYSMMDKVRQARTGTKKQGKEINPNKYMPA